MPKGETISDLVRSIRGSEVRISSMLIDIEKEKRRGFTIVKNQSKGQKPFCGCEGMILGLKLTRGEFDYLLGVCTSSKLAKGIC